MKRGLCLLCIAVMMLTMSGCAPLYAVLDELVGNEQVAAVEATPHIGFSNGDVATTDNIITVEEFDALPIAYSEYRSSVLFDTLSATEKTVYRAFEYALENEYTNILIDTHILTDSDRLIDILYFLALDSPLLEQNLRYETGTFTLSQSVSILDLYTREAAFTGLYVTVDNFSRQWWEPKMRALAKAEEIVAELPGELSEAEIAEELYRYVGENAVYELYDEDEDGEVFPYLSDTLIVGKSQCDGFANALALLFRLAGLESVEKQYTTDSADETGHTWNCVNIDGIWYNVDGTMMSWIPAEGCAMGGGIGFAFPDELQSTPTDYEELYPACDNGLYMPVDVRLSSTSDSAFVDNALEAYESHDSEWAYMLVDEFNEDALDDRMQEFANRIYGTIHYIDYPTDDGKTAILIHNGECLD